MKRSFYFNKSGLCKWSQFKIFTQINVSCATCIQKLAKWQNFIKQLDGCDSIYLIPVCKSKDKFELIKYLRSGWRAFWYNNTASLFNMSLKLPFDPLSSEEDYLIEDILQRLFQTEQLDYQKSFYVNL